jgi:lipopolysaccharide/colanic/teichoic acid biosynthesis glycosyltransferase
MATHQQLTNGQIAVTGFIPPQAAARTARRAAASSRRQGRQALRPSDAVGNQRHVVNEVLFRGALIRERKCADRSDQPFALLLVAASSRSVPAIVWDAVIATLETVRRETDVLGWFEQGAALGLVIPEIDPCDRVSSGLESQVQQELSRRLTPALASAVSARLYVHTPARGTERVGAPLDTLLPQSAVRKPRWILHDVLKRSLDVGISLALLILLAPLLLLIAALVKLKSPGPVLFRQVRIGAHGQPFTMLKSRTMHQNADSGVHHEYVSWFIKSSGKAASGQSGVFKLENDRRITPIGRILRKTSLDELPQLWNVFRGDMSLVGPRPPLPYEVEQYKAWHCRRVLEAKPGITGLWQVTGRSRTTFDEMVRLDLRYARTYSLWTDIKILLATPRAVISGKGAC